MGYGPVRRGYVETLMGGYVETARLAVPQEPIQIDIEMWEIPLPFLIVRIEKARLRIDSDHALGPLPCVTGCGGSGTLTLME